MQEVAVFEFLSYMAPGFDLLGELLQPRRGNIKFRDRLLMIRATLAMGCLSKMLAFTVLFLPNDAISISSSIKHGNAMPNKEDCYCLCALTCISMYRNPAFHSLTV